MQAHQIIYIFHDFFSRMQANQIIDTFRCRLCWTQNDHDMRYAFRHESLQQAQSEISFF
jgi:hypothetical protein